MAVDGGDAADRTRRGADRSRRGRPSLLERLAVEELRGVVRVSSPASSAGDAHARRVTGLSLGRGSAATARGGGVGSIGDVDVDRQRVLRRRLSVVTTVCDAGGLGEVARPARRAGSSSAYGERAAASAQVSAMSTLRSDHAAETRDRVRLEQAPRELDAALDARGDVVLDRLVHDVGEGLGHPGRDLAAAGRAGVDTRWMMNCS